MSRVLHCVLLLRWWITGLKKFHQPDVIKCTPQACGSRSCVNGGNSVHCLARKFGFGVDLYMRNHLISMYALFCNMDVARKMFDESSVRDLVTWNTLLAGYVSLGDVNEAKLVFHQMPSNNAIASNSMKCPTKCLVEDAQKLFDEMPHKEILSWTAMVTCYEQNEMYEDALKAFTTMVGSGVPIDEIISLSVLSACAKSFNVSGGEAVHAMAVKTGFQAYLNLQNALINLYSSCGNIKAAERLLNGSVCVDIITWNSLLSGYMKTSNVEKAEKLFDEMPERDVVSWGTMISRYTQQGYHSNALSSFQQMYASGIKPDDVALNSAITACTLNDKIEPNVRHYSCMVDLLARAGRLEEAERVIDEMPTTPDASTWGALLGACKWHGNAEMGERVGKKVIDLAPKHAGFHVMLSNIYASEGNWEGASEIREMMVENGVLKTPRWSLIEADGRMHEFLSGD